jgi:uncharacterized protein
VQLLNRYEAVRLNRRMAADLYLDVVAITKGAESVRVAGHGPIIEHAVRMKQFDLLAAIGQLPAEWYDLLGRLP